MRGTQKISNANNLLYISRNFSSLNKVSGQLANQRQVMNLKDDPMAANIGIQMATLVARSEQYSRNIKSGLSQLQLSDSRLQTAKTQIDKIKDIIEGAANEPSTSAETRSASAVQLNEIFKTLVSLGNASDGSRYIFGGSKTTSSPFEIVNGRYVNYTGNQDQINIVVDSNVTMPINVTGSDVYGNMTTTISSKDMNPDVNLTTDHATRLSDLNGGEGVPTGKIVVKYSAYPNGLEVDLSHCDTLEDVKDAIEQQTLAASRLLNTNDHGWLDSSTLDWHDLQDRYVKVTMNPDGNGISLMEYDLGEALPEPTTSELRKGLDYSPEYKTNGVGGQVWDETAGLFVDRTEDAESAVHLMVDADARTYTPLSVDDYASNKVAEGLGIRGASSIPAYDRAAGVLSVDQTKSGFIHGRDLNPVLSERTLLADLDGYNDATYTFTNGPKEATVQISEVSQDSNNVFNNWDLDGATVGRNTGSNGELYSVIVKRGDEYHVELYTKPYGKHSASDLVATGTIDPDRGGTVQLKEVNSSGLTGSVGIVMSDTLKTSLDRDDGSIPTDAKVSLEISFPDALQGSVHVPAFVEEQNPDGTSKDEFNIASGWNIKGLDKPPATGYNENHPASTDLDGDVSVNYRYEDGFLYVELSRPAFNDQPAALIATGKLEVGTDFPLSQSVSGRVEFTGEEGFEAVSGSVFIELPTGTAFANATAGGSEDSPTENTHILQNDAAAGSLVLGGATELVADLGVNYPEANPLVLSGDTLFKKGQVFANNVRLPDGRTLEAGSPLEEDTTLGKGVRVAVSSLKEGTVLAAGQALTSDALPAGTVIPRGTYYTDGNSFQMGGGAMSVDGGDAKTMGYDVRATFATIEDLNRAIEELGIHVSASVSSNGKGLEFTSRLAGAWLTVSEDTDCYEQMGDVNNQLSGLNLNGLVKGNNTDAAGNVYTEVIFYPPNNPEKDADGNIIPVRLVGENGDITEIEPGYYIRVYSDKSALDKSYEDRGEDVQALQIAQGFVPAGEWNAAGDGFEPAGTVGLENGVQLVEMNNSGVNGTVDLNYYGGREQRQPVLDADDNVIGYDYNPWVNDNITVFPGGLRSTSSTHATIQQADIYDMTQGVHADYSGNIHGTLTKSEDGATFQVALHRDKSHTNVTGKSLPVAMSGDNQSVTIYAVNDKGQFIGTDGMVIDESRVEADGVKVGTMVVNATDMMGDGVASGTVDTFTLSTGAGRNYGQEREENVFSTINDAIDALNKNDTDRLHYLLEDAQNDIDRILRALSDVGAREQRMTLLDERHQDDVVSYSDLFTKRVGMDDTALAKAVLSYQAATNSYQAAMQVSASIMQMSLLQYI